MEQALRDSLRMQHAAGHASERQIADSLPVRDATTSDSSRTRRASSAGRADDINHDGPVIVSMPSTRTVPMTLPAMLKQNVPGFKARNARLAQLQQQAQARSASKDKDAAGERAAQHKFGKRKQRRWENVTFYGSKHVVAPRASDFAVGQRQSEPSFPSPPPSTFFPYKPSSNPAADPNARSYANVFDDSSVSSADYGRFSLPIKGLKRNTRRFIIEGGIGGQIVNAVDAELRAWLEGTGVWLLPESSAPHLNSGKRCICQVDTDHGRVHAINQLAKQPHSLIWQSEDSFTRYLIHAVARYYRIVSFTKTDPSTSAHLIWLLRPNMGAKTGSDPLVKPTSGLETPPTTASEWEASSQGALTTSASELDSAPSGSETRGTVTSESDSDLLDGEGNETITAREEEDAVIVSRGLSDEPSRAESADLAAAQSRQAHRRRRRRLRSSMTPGGKVLSDIDSGAEVDDEKEEGEDAADADLLGDSIADLNLETTAAGPQRYRRTSRGHPIRSQPGHRGEESISRESSPRRTSMSDKIDLQKVTAPKIARKGWTMPNLTFSEWVLRG